MSHDLDTLSQRRMASFISTTCMPSQTTAGQCLSWTSTRTSPEFYQKPGFHPEARYEFKVHFDGADFEALTYRVSFGEADSDGRQAVRRQRSHWQRRAEGLCGG